MLGGHHLKDSKCLSPMGSIAASPAATAYFLAAVRDRGGDLPSAYHYLNQFNHSNITAAPNVFPIDEFELAFSANYLLEAGVSPEKIELKTIISKIFAQWQARPEGGLGYSSHFTIDPDCTANGLRALMLAGHKDLNPNVLLKFFNGTYMETYASELNPSVSTNLHTLQALRLLPQTAEIKNVIARILSWLNQQANSNGPVLIDKWHFSPIYPIARAVIALAGLDDTLVQRCVEYLCKSQHANGGWGEFGYSTSEETAFASLALSYWAKNHDISFAVLKSAKYYLDQADSLPEDALWIGKVLYCPYYVVASILGAAKIALRTQDQIFVS
jgi:halimadienyl-diphosphate synthase